MHDASWRHIVGVRDAMEFYIQVKMISWHHARLPGKEISL